ncbi:uncharacterized protein LOC111078271 [Drosophila obscura]|uniref:uncharacterized protein LOC111078271 n=1 Tax=Drosophila obscura TaxID=7282 RepID=UPI001BB266C3|nr:uncharacterized protein LOC111078271 [Drosophila obscura]
MADPTTEMDAAVSPMEINISNKNLSSMIVVNDLRLLQLIFKYPFLYSKAAQSEQDSDYTEWAWKQIAVEFNASYEDLPLSAPFSPDELQWRWNMLLPVIGALSKAKEIPFQLFTIVTEIERSLNAEIVEPPIDLTMAQNFLLSQLPLVESMTRMERRRLEAEFLDIIFQLELETRGSVPVGPDEKATIKVEYDEFLRSIRVKELPISALARLTLEGSDIKPVQANQSPASATPGCSIKTSNLVISNVFCAKDVIDNPSTKTVATPQQGCPSNLVERIDHAATDSAPIGAQNEAIERAPSVSPPLDFKTEVEVAIAAIELAIEMENKRGNKPAEVNQKQVTAVDKPQADAALIENLRYIPIKSAKYYTKKVRVRVKRIDLHDFMPLSSIARRPKRRKSIYIKCT